MYGLNRNTKTPQVAQGEIQGPKGRDAVPLWGENGEYVLPKEVVAAMGGAEALDAMVAAVTGKPPGGQPVSRDNSVFSEAAQPAPGGLRPIEHAPAEEPAPGLGMKGFNRGGRIDPSIPERPARPESSRADSAPVGRGLVSQARDSLVRNRNRAQEVADRAVRGYNSGGAVLAEGSPRGFGLKRQPKNAQPQPRLGLKGYNAGGAIGEDERRQQGVSAPSAPATQAAAAPTAATAPTQPSTGWQRTGLGNPFRSQPMSAADQGLSVRNVVSGPIAGTARGFGAAKQAALDPAAQFTKTLVTGDTTPIGGMPSAGSRQDQELQANNARIMSPDFNPFGTIPQGSAPGGMMRPEARAQAAQQAQQEAAASAAGRTPGAQPQPFTQGIDMAGANRNFAEANQIRAGNAALRDQIAFNQGGGALFGRPANPEQASRMQRMREDNQSHAELQRRNMTQEALDREMFRRPTNQADIESQKQRVAALREQLGDASDQVSGAAKSSADMQQTQLREQSATDRARMQQEADAPMRNEQVAQQRMQNQMTDQQQSLMQRLEAETDPEQRAVLSQQLRAIMGQSDQQNRFTVVPGGQEWDSVAGAMRTVPARVINNQTGQFVEQGAQQGAGQFEEGRLYVDANGNRATFRNGQWVPAS